MPEKPLNQLDPGLQRQVEHARTALDRGNLDYAIGLFRDVLRREPGCLAVRRVLRAAQLKRLGSHPGLKEKSYFACRLPGLAWARLVGKRIPSRSMDRAERVLDWNPRHHGAQRCLADAALILDLPETAVFALEGALESAPGDHKAALALARTHLELGRPQDALVILEAWSRRRPRDDVFRDLLKEALVTSSLHAGHWDSDSGTYRDKLRDEEEAVELEKRGRSETPDGSLRKMVVEALKSVEAEPQALSHHVTLIRAYQDLEDFDQALEWLDRARQLQAGASDPSLARRGVEIKVAQLKQENPSEDSIRDLRIVELDRLVSGFPREFTFRFEVAELLRDAGRPDEAIHHFQEIRGAETFRVRAASGLGDCFRSKGLMDLAIEQYRTAGDGLPVMDDLKKHVLYQLAICYEATGEAAQATDAFKQIYSVDIGYLDVSTRIESTYDRS
ncbi:MAG: hypothetical protein DRI24_24140 [Deltaproteobacteria bacterium]|nr:MAG: hypothetical protein DRI24_24140 [Deltaproteobacteria bacterium]